MTAWFNHGHPGSAVTVELPAVGAAASSRRRTPAPILRRRRDARAPQRPEPGGPRRVGVDRASGAP